jgi:hypothetical protein
MAPRFWSRLRLASLSPAHSRFAFAAVSAILLAWTAARVTRAGNAHRAALSDTRQTIAMLDSWRRGFEAPAPAESLAWRRAALDANELGIAGDERLALTQAISRAAESAGLRDVRVRVSAADTTGSEARLSTEGVRRQPATFGLLVECRGNLQAVVNLLGQLPPSVAATSLHLVRQDDRGRARHRIVLAVYELSFSHGIPTLGSPLERRNPRDGSDGRIGG